MKNNSMKICPTCGAEYSNPGTLCIRCRNADYRRRHPKEPKGAFGLSFDPWKSPDFLKARQSDSMHEFKEG